MIKCIASRCFVGCVVFGLLSILAPSVYGLILYTISMVLAAITFVLDGLKEETQDE